MWALCILPTYTPQYPDLFLMVSSQITKSSIYSSNSHNKICFLVSIWLRTYVLIKSDWFLTYFLVGRSSNSWSHSRQFFDGSGSLGPDSLVLGHGNFLIGQVLFWAFTWVYNPLLVFLMHVKTHYYSLSLSIVLVLVYIDEFWLIRYCVYFWDNLSINHR